MVHRAYQPAPSAVVYPGIPYPKFFFVPWGKPNWTNVPSYGGAFVNTAGGYGGPPGGPPPGETLRGSGGPKGPRELGGSRGYGVPVGPSRGPTPGGPLPPPGSPPPSGGPPLGGPSSGSFGNQPPNQPVMGTSSMHVYQYYYGFIGP